VPGNLSGFQVLDLGAEMIEGEITEPFEDTALAGPENR
jgi:hypothetical protein